MQVPEVKKDHIMLQLLKTYQEELKGNTRTEEDEVKDLSNEGLREALAR